MRFEGGIGNALIDGVKLARLRLKKFTKTVALMLAFGVGANRLTATAGITNDLPVWIDGIRAEKDISVEPASSATPALMTGGKADSEKFFASG